MTQYAFHFDSSRCTGCKTCQVACKETYKLGPNNLYRKVLNYQGGTWKPTEAGHYVPEGVFGYFVSLACNHCTDAACVANCPTGAMQKDPETGIVNNDKEKCIGCMTCEKSCPYGHPVQLDDGLSHKCVLCSDENPEGVPDPTCAKACPVRALEFGTLAELRERHPEGVSALGELTDETAPAVVFAPHRDAAKGGVLHNPQEVSHEA